MSDDLHLPRPDSKTLLKGGAALGAVGASLLDGGAAAAASKAQKAQAEALREAAASRPAMSQPAAVATADHYVRAKLLLAGGDVPGAMAAFRRVLAEEPRSIDAMNGLGVTYDRMGRHDVARGWYEAALAVAPDDGAILANLGYSLTLQGEWREAIPWLQAATHSRDMTAVATARRLLVRVNAELTAARVRQGAFARPAELALQIPAAVAAPVQLAAAGRVTPALPKPQAALPLIAGGSASAMPIAIAVVAVPPSVGFAPAPHQIISPPVTAVSNAVSADSDATVPQPGRSVGAHIEYAANGEAQLVMGGARVPAATLVASLGDAAVLVLAPLAPVTLPPLANDGGVMMMAQAPMAVQAPPKGRAKDAAAPAARPSFQQTSVMVEMPVAVLSLASAPEITLIPSFVAARAEAETMLIAASQNTIAPIRQTVRAAAARVEVARAETAPAAAQNAPVDIMAFAVDGELAPAALARTSVEAGPVLRAVVAIGPAGAHGPSARAPGHPNADPAWLLHIRRAGPDGRSAPSAPALALGSADIGSTRLFDSDDGALNSFAARLRAPQGADIDPASAVARQAAVARLEAVIVRARAA